MQCPNTVTVFPVTTVCHIILDYNIDKAEPCLTGSLRMDCRWKPLPLYIYVNTQRGNCFLVYALVLGTLFSPFFCSYECILKTLRSPFPSVLLLK